MGLDLNPIGQILPSAGKANDSGLAAGNLADNFDTFLRLLTSQLQNQDPLNPMDSQEFVTQLVQFSSVEQQIAQTRSLDALLALQGANAAMSAAGYVGRDVTVSADTAEFKDGKARWSYELPRSTQRTDLTISDSAGRVVAALPGQTGSGKHDFVWDGRDAAGNAMPAGVYSLQVTARDSEGEEVKAAVRISGRVTGVDLSGGEARVELGAIKAPFVNVIAVREAGA
ncbi:flagellar hook assembly protein FlgD [Alkalicaulis satelles]|uniref:Basal-body rod modification protein FlgD n=1 Tax=Alkalicaulis satelles TaxID=2609175 RepID=A0A5M6ZIY4_9PROT|nr:flagellar hook assembly protein FlgD [Alkalicaulis satelles]KAA5802181.1 flagellar hook assembly protein FlgD [Alkalicaulis satelles]